MTANRSPSLAIFGLTGRTGLALARDARARGSIVQGLVRRTTPDLEQIQVRIVSGEFDDTDRVLDAVRDAHAVCCVIGPRPPFRDVFCAAATEAIVGAMRGAGCRRLVCLTGAMIGAAVPNRSRPMEWMARLFARRTPDAAADRARQEAIVEASGLDWTIVKPPRLTDGPATRRVRAGTDLRVGLLSRISRADLAAFMLDEVERGAFARQRVFVSG